MAIGIATQIIKENINDNMFNNIMNVFDTQKMKKSLEQHTYKFHKELHTSFYKNS